jgi:hypothetical protein
MGWLRDTSLACPAAQALRDARTVGRHSAYPETPAGELSERPAMVTNGRRAVTVSTR